MTQFSEESDFIEHDLLEHLQTNLLDIMPFNNLDCVEFVRVSFGSRQLHL